MGARHGCFGRPASRARRYLLPAFWSHSDYWLLERGEYCRRVYLDSDKGINCDRNVSMTPQVAEETPTS